MHSSSPERVPSGDVPGGFCRVKEDVSGILRGVANFFSPPPSYSSATRPSKSPPRGLVGLKNDLAEIGECFKSSFSRLSGNKAVSGISKFASQLLLIDDQDGSQGVPGTNDEVLRFVKGISERPDYWTDFPLPLDNAAFSMSHLRMQHALTIEELLPEFVELRLDLCSYMNVEKFWLIYFMLLFPKLDQCDSELLSSAKIVEARSMLMKKIKDDNDATLQEDNSENPRNLSPHQEGGNDSSPERDNISSDENQILAEITSATKCLDVDDDAMSSSARCFADIDIGNCLAKLKHGEEDVPFSDPEEEEEEDKTAISGSERLPGSTEARDLTMVSSRDGCSDWVELSENFERDVEQKAVHLKGTDSEDESNDWFTV